MSDRALVLMWIVIGVVVWNGVFDLYVSEGTREYLQIVAEVRAGYGVERTVTDVMNWWKNAGAMAATGWAAFIVGAGLLTVWLKRAPTLS